MRRWLLRVSVVLCALAVLAGGSWWAWREWWSAEHLLAAIEANNTKHAMDLLAWGPRVDGQSREILSKNWTPIHFAVHRGNVDLIKLLLENKANVNDMRGGDAPIHLAPHHGRLDIVELLLQAGADIQAINGTGLTVLHYAALYGKPKLVRFFLESGLEVDLPDKNGQTPLMHSAWMGRNNQTPDRSSPTAYIETIRILLKAGADPYRKDKNGYTPATIHTGLWYIAKEVKGTVPSLNQSQPLEERPLQDSKGFR